MANNWRPSWKNSPGANYAPAYEVAGIPFVSGSIECVNNPHRVVFPYVTEWITVINRSQLRSLKVGFSEAGVKGSNYFRVASHNTGPLAPGRKCVESRLEVKVGEIWLYNSENCDIIAGLTNISTDHVSGSKGPSWSGSAGVG